MELLESARYDILAVVGQAKNIGQFAFEINSDGPETSITVVLQQRVKASGGNTTPSK
jgi:predicted hotdog family 3-hydroxylacyl-ACP dehydratase